MELVFEEFDKSASSVWIDILGEIAKLVPEKALNIWFKNTKGLYFKDRTLYVAVPNDFYRDWLVTHYLEKIKLAVKNLGLKIKVELIVQKEQEDSERTFVVTLHPGTRLIKRYKFENFIEGPYTQLAVSAAKAVALEPLSGLYNPLIFFGNSGLGKTHLLHAIGNYITEHFSRLKVLYVPSESLLNEMIKAIQQDSIDRFRSKYRSLDVLLIDDFDFMAKKSFFQEELLNTLDFLLNTGKRIVIASRKHPGDISHVSRALVTRLQKGLLIEIKPPDLETRIKILQYKLNEVGLELSRKVVIYLARNVKNSVSEIEGCVNRLKAAKTLLNTELTLETVEEILQEFLRSSSLPTPEEVLRTTAEVFRVRVKDITGKRRHAPIVRARHTVAYILHEYLGYSYPEIGKFLGRDHSTIINSYEKAKKLLLIDTNFSKKIGKLKHILGIE